MSMTSLDFYQTWQSLIMQNTQVNKSIIYSPVAWVIFLFCLVSLLRLCEYILEQKESKSKMFFKMISIVFSLCLISFLISVGVLLFGANECDSLVCSKTKYPEYDYTVEEFKQNMASIGNKADPVQIKVAEILFKRCTKDLPDTYQVKGSFQVRECVGNKVKTNVEFFRNDGYETISIKLL